LSVEEVFAALEPLKSWEALEGPPNTIRLLLSNFVYSLFQTCVSSFLNLGIVS